ncbi:MAG TPA: lipid A export permease/ATP-binding protein MsbA [Candidatus Binatia bacterium]|nr:lipid A export permease/ATP-binding protein MsbA [Candidatus Binatia bacterium]
MKLYTRLLGYLRPYVWPRFTLAVFCMVLYSSTNGVMPYLVRSVFDDVFVQKQQWALRVLPVAIVAVFLFRAAMSFSQSYLTEWIGQHVIADIRSQLNAHFQRLSLSFYNRTPTATLLSRMTNDVELMRNALTDAVASVMKDLTSLLVLLTVGFFMDWRLALIAFVAFPVTVLPILRLSRRLRRVTRKGQVTLGSLATLLQETIQGNRVVKAFGMEDYEIRRFDAESARLVRLYMKAARIKAFTTPMMEVLASFGIAGVVWYGGSSVMTGGRTPGSFMGFCTVMLLIYDPFKGLTKTNNVVQQGLAAASRIFEMLDQQSEVVEHPQAIALGGFHDGIRFENVSFRYGAEPVLREVNLEIRRGEAVALVGRSGAGKSTLADLIPRFYDVTGGRITVDGNDVRDLTLASLRAEIAIVTQFTFLFNDSVRNNIAYGNVGTSMEQIAAAARAANAHDFICELPQGYDTVVGELGVNLSGGQRQRLAIARALLKNVPILILDEATSALDNESERLVQEAIERLIAGRTTLVIAHRLSTIRNADRIVVLEGGRIIEEGTHGELLDLGGEYRRLYDMQFRDEPRAAVAGE